MSSPRHGIGPASDEVGWLDPLQVFWSSGTTGRSKGIIHSHSGVLTNADLWLSGRVRQGDVSYVCTPYYLSGAWNCGIWSGLVTGTEVAVDNQFSVGRFWDRVRHFGATHIFTIGAMHMYLWNQPTRPDDAQSGVRHAMCIPMSWSLIPQFKERFGIGRMDQTYGATETLMLLRADDDGTTWPDAAMGVALPDYEVRLLDEDDLEVPVGEVGEVCVRPNVPGRLFLGYLNAGEQTVAGWRNLWHHQGDLAWRDEDGVYYFADRKKDYVRYAGRNISLTEVEGVVTQHPDVADLAAFGVVSAEIESESELALAVVVKAGSALSADDLARFIGDHAPYYFVPRYIEFVEAIPRNAHHKVLRDVLRDRGVSELAWDRRAAGFRPPGSARQDAADRRRPLSCKGPARPSHVVADRRRVRQVDDPARVLHRLVEDRHDGVGGELRIEPAQAPVEAVPMRRALRRDRDVNAQAVDGDPAAGERGRRAHGQVLQRGFGEAVQLERRDGVGRRDGRHVDDPPLTGRLEVRRPLPGSRPSAPTR